MLSGILEVTACIIAALFGMAGVFYGLSISNYYLSSAWFISISGTLVVIVVIYLSQLAEAMQKESKTNIVICQVLNKLMYATIVSQVIAAILMVQ